MIVLGIETSDDFVGVGLADESGVINSIASEPEMRNKNILHELIKDILESSGKALSDIEGVSVSLGPGSFTGLRVGLAAAKGICWAKNIPLTGIPSIQVIADSLGFPEGRFIAVKDARRGEFYYGGFECDGANWFRLIPDETGSVDDILKLQSEGFSIVGRRHQLEKSGISAENMVEYNPDDLGGTVALLGQKKIEEGVTLNIAATAPEYLRNPGLGKSRR